MSKQLFRQLPALIAALSLAACAEAPEDERERRERLSVGAEVFRVFCKRKASAAFPDDLEGTTFSAACEGRGEPPRHEAHFDALLARRGEIVAALDRVLGDEAVAKEIAAQLEEDEIHDFLGELVPLYDPPAELMPGGSRAVAEVLARLLDEKDATGKKALDVLARTTGRTGYRPLQLALGVVRPLLEYPHLDDLMTSSIQLVARGGKAEREYDEVVRGLALELATYEDTKPAPDSTLVLAKNLLLSPLPDLDEAARTPLWLVRRDERGVALPNLLKGNLPEPFADEDADTQADIDAFGRLVAQKGIDRIPSPFATRKEPPTMRDPEGRALNVWAGGDELLYDHLDVQKAMLAALVREQTKLLGVSKPGDRTTLEKVSRGLPALLGTKASRKVTYGKADVEFEGPDPATGPVFDLVHAIGSIAARPETEKALMVLEATLRDHEPASAQLMQTLLAINERGKKHPEAELIGENGPGTPHRFWDDLLGIAKRITDRPGLLEAIMRSVLDARAPAQGPLLANWMRYRDVVTYRNAPSQDPADINAPIEHTYAELVDRTAPNTGTNRSIFQRTMHMVHQLHGMSQCNKPNAKLKVSIGIQLELPLFSDGYAPCELFEVPDMVEIHILSVLDRARIDLKPGDLQALGQLCPLGIVDATCLGQTQEKESQIVGFDDTPTPQALARFVFSPPNEFLRGISDPVPSRDGFYIKDIEPYALFPMEVVDPSAKPKGAGDDHPGLTFLEAGYSLMQAFDDHELRDDGHLIDGYLFGDLLSTLHMHWSARSDAPCNGPPEPTCTQRVDPTKPLFSYQTNIQSYEPLIAEALADEQLLDVLHEATKALAEVKIDGEDGITIMARFVELMLKPDPALTYRDGRTTALTNVGEEVGYVSPMYLLLDALKGIDQSFATKEHEARLAVWREARSELVDAFLTIEEVDGQKRMKDRLGRAITLRMMKFLRDRIAAHRDAGDLEAWAASLAPRLEDLLDRPVVAAALKLLDRAWEDERAGAEFARLTDYLFSDEGPGFAVSLVAGADLLQLLDDTESIAPLLDLAAEAIGPGVTQSVDVTGKAFSSEDGIARRVVELQSAISKIDTGRPSTTAKLFRNLVAASMGDGSTPLETLLDAVADIERADPKTPSDVPLDRKDLVSVISSLHSFMTDPDHGLERLYAVIQHRKLDKEP